MNTCHTHTHTHDAVKVEIGSRFRVVENVYVSFKRQRFTFMTLINDA